MNSTHPPTISYPLCLYGPKVKPACIGKPGEVHWPLPNNSFSVYSVAFGNPENRLIETKCGFRTKYMVYHSGGGVML